MKYVQRINGIITGVYTCPQKQEDGSCLTDPDPLPDDHPEIVAYREKLAIPAPKRLTDGDLATALVKAGILTQQQIDAALQAAQVSVA